MQLLCDLNYVIHAESKGNLYKNPNHLQNQRNDSIQLISVIKTNLEAKRSKSEYRWDRSKTGLSGILKGGNGLVDR